MRRALLEELGVGDDVELHLRHLRRWPRAPCPRCPPARCSCPPPPCTGACARPICSRGGQHVLQVRVAALALGGAHGDEDHLGGRHRLARSVVKESRLSRTLLADELLQARLVDGHLARLQRADLPLVDVHADDVVARVREAGARDEADVARSDDGDAHETPGGDWCPPTHTPRAHARGSRRHPHAAREAGEGLLPGEQAAQPVRAPETRWLPGTLTGSTTSRFSSSRVARRSGGTRRSLRPASPGRAARRWTARCRGRAPGRHALARSCSTAASTGRE